MHPRRSVFSGAVRPPSVLGSDQTTEAGAVEWVTGTNNPRQAVRGLLHGDGHFAH